MSKIIIPKTQTYTLNTYIPTSRSNEIQRRRRIFEVNFRGKLNQMRAKFTLKYLSR